MCGEEPLKASWRMNETNCLRRSCTKWNWPLFPGTIFLTYMILAIQSQRIFTFQTGGKKDEKNWTPNMTTIQSDDKMLIRITE